ncbi:aldehyde dehydrogenase family protein [Parendozoicomonas haliclonae]|uniref:Succinate-semialdehyde dehydrogenase [NADP(+)] n=1 Tax=Parendozoicomonas haliclonae TaxID=1960125 RepID=A0A1X7AIL9_9GAMM|nr:aldehyde dehydrogenase family protein [Parendozoicomonas haliclonae]SMA45409.1 Succinate-semialdehyde dehydrogenase [NADP(+)] [Parendozoicomonas haliclonae]
MNVLKSFNPADGELVGEVTVTPADQIPAVVAQAKEAAKIWRRKTAKEQLAIVEAAYAKAEPHAERLAQLLSMEMGKDIRRSTSEVQGSIFSGPYIGQGVVEALKSRNLGHGTTLQYQPLGVAAVISPWNYPLAMANNLIIPALIAGNTVVFKPSEETPLIAQAFVEILNQTLPEHVLQIIHGDSEQGKALVESDVDIVAFTGSMAAGRDIMQRAAGSLKRLVMELGGNDPMIVMNNANIEAAARFAVGSSVENAGQMCTSTERIYVDERIADRFEQRVVELTSSLSVGPWNQPGVNVGPIINERQHNRIVEHIRDAEVHGAKVLLGGSNQPERYIQPTVITGLTKAMRMESEETFGPVVAISRFTNIQEAIERANDSIYGLGAVVFGGQGAEAVAEQMEAGMVGINQGPGGAGEAPWVGAKQSGFGFHGSAEGHRQFAQVRVIGK